MQRLASLFMFSLVLAALDSGMAKADDSTPIPDSCPVTLPIEPRFVPPPPQKAMQPGSPMFWYGSSALFTHLSSSGRWSGIESRTGIRNKSFWYRDNKDWRDDRPGPHLLVTVRRLDGAGEWKNTSPVNNAIMGEEWAALLMLELPTRGCWQVSANYKSDYVSFVVWVD